MIGLGIDGGGTKTEALLVGHDGRILGKGRAGPTNMFFVSREDAWTAFTKAVDDAVAQAGSVAIDGMCVSAEVPDEVLADLAAHYHIPAWQHTLEPVTALASARPFTSADIRIVLCAGTGAMATGVDDEGQHITAGAAGPLIGDEGSAYWLGLRALVYTFQAFDRQIAPTPLTRRIHQYLGAPADFHAFVGRVYGPPAMDRFEIASLGPYVTEAAGQGDALAVAIVEEGVRELVRLVDTLVRRLGLQARPFAILPYGGVFHAGPAVGVPFEKAVLAVVPQAEVLPPVFHPVLGAALMALGDAHTKLSPEALSRLAAESERWNV
jgi:N-acetylglucosamine kinase-like BadF-type ATPase